MDSGCEHSPDTSEAFFTPQDYEKFSVFHYMMMRDIRNRGQGEISPKEKNKNELINENGPIKNENGHLLNKSNAANLNVCGNPVQNGSSAQRTAKGMATMSTFEHKLYLQLKAKYSNSRKIAETAGELQDMQVLADLEMRVLNERNKFNEYLYNTACTSRRQDYFNMHPEAKLYITDILRRELQYCRKYHPRLYLTNRIIPLLPPGLEKEIPFTFIKVILRLGHALPLIVPASTQYYNVYIKYNILKRKFPPEDVDDHETHPSKQHISRDRIAHNLGAKYGADIVISLTSLKTLVDNVFPKVEHDWEIPVIVCEDQGDSGAPRKCIYVEKPIPHSSLSAREKGEMYFGYALRHKFTPSNPPRSRKSMGGGYAPPVIPDDIKPVPEEVQAEVDKKMSGLTSFDDICEFSENVCDLDTFGIAVPKKPPSQPKVSLNEQNLVLEENKQDIESAEDSNAASSDEFDELPIDVSLLSQIKEVLMEQKKKTNSTLSNSPGSAVADVLDLEKDDSVKSDCFAQCMSPLSNADSEQDRLVIDCDIEDKQSDYSASSPCETKTATVDEMLEKPVSAKVEHCHLETNGKNDTDSENEVFKKRKRKIGRLLIESDTESDDKNTVSSETGMKPAMKKSRLLAVVKSIKAKKMLSPKSKSDGENKAPKENLESHTANPPQESTLDTILVSQHKMLNPGDKIDGDTEKIIPSQFIATDSTDETADGYPQLPPLENVQYSLWRLGDLKIMLRSEIDAQVSTTGRPSFPVFLFPKLEYQSRFGVEITTPSELIKQWVALHTHPGSHLVKVRVDGQRSTLSMLEEIDLPHLPKNKQDLNPKHAIHQLHTILNTLKSLSEGQYLLTHKKGDLTLTVRNAVTAAKPGAFDLHASIEQRLESLESCEDTDSIRKEVPWLPIDSAVALPEQKRDNRIPGCFFPTDFWKFKNKTQQNKSQPQKKKR